MWGFDSEGGSQVSSEESIPQLIVDIAQEGHEIHREEDAIRDCRTMARVGIPDTFKIATDRWSGFKKMPSQTALEMALNHRAKSLGLDWVSRNNLVMPSAWEKITGCVSPDTTHDGRLTSEVDRAKESASPNIPFKGESMVPMHEDKNKEINEVIKDLSVDKKQLLTVGWSRIVNINGNVLPGKFEDEIGEIQNKSERRIECFKPVWEAHFETGGRIIGQAYEDDEVYDRDLGIVLTEIREESEYTYQLIEDGFSNIVGSGFIDEGIDVRLEGTGAEDSS